MDYKNTVKEVTGFAESEPWYVPLLSNVSALLYEELEDVNWLGFYILKDGQLLVGPFQGRVACIRIPIGKGVCGTAVRDDRTIRVEDVHEFPGHIACDSRSLSELVIPIHSDGRIIGVMDIDSPIKGRFSAEDEEGLTMVVQVIEKYIKL